MQTHTHTQQDLKHKMSHRHVNLTHAQTVIPCLSWICPPFITAILLLSMGPGGSKPAERDREREREGGREREEKNDLNIT